MLRGNLDEVFFIDPLGRDVELAGPRTAPEGAVVYLRGWAYLTEPDRRATSIVGRIDDGPEFELAYNQDRPDVAGALGLDALRTVGFLAVHSLVGIEPGTHAMSLFGRDERGGLHPFDAPMTFGIVPGREAFPYSVELQGTMAIERGWLRFNENDLEPIEGPVLTMPRGGVALAAGWAIDTVYRTPASDVYACVDRRVFTRGIVGRARTDASNAVGIAEAWRCGYVVRIATAGLELGRHAVHILAVSADGLGYESTPEIVLELV
jgi:hypothetical protein